MKLAEMLKELHDKKTGIFVNGIGLGRIAEIDDDFINLEVIKKENDKKGKKLTKEITHIPISQIATISEGEKEIPRSESDATIDSELEVI